VIFLESRNEVDEQGIGNLGICTSGGYVFFAAETDERINGVGTVSGVDMGDLFRKGLPSSMAPNLQNLFKESGKARTEARGQPPRMEHIVSNTPEEVPKDAPTLYRERTDYYLTPRGQHPNSKNWFLLKIVDQNAENSSYEHVDMISPRPLLMIAGTNADTRFFGEEAIEKAKTPKEIFLIDGATHVALYDKREHVDPAVDKLNSFYKQYLHAG